MLSEEELLAGKYEKADFQDVQVESLKTRLTMLSKDEHTNMNDELEALTRDAPASFVPDVREELSALATVARLETAQLDELADALKVLASGSSVFAHVICDWPTGKKCMIAAEAVTISKDTRGTAYPHSRSLSVPS